jgi:hypothetical protein
MTPAASALAVDDACNRRFATTIKAHLELRRFFPFVQYILQSSATRDCHDRAHNFRYFGLARTRRGTKKRLDGLGERRRHFVLGSGAMAMEDVQAHIGLTMHADG